MWKTFFVHVEKKTCYSFVETSYDKIKQNV